MCVGYSLNSYAPRSPIFCAPRSLIPYAPALIIQMSDAGIVTGEVVAMEPHGSGDGPRRNNNEYRVLIEDDVEEEGEEEEEEIEDDVFVHDVVNPDEDREAVAL